MDVFIGDKDIRTETIVHHIDHLAHLVRLEHLGPGQNHVVDQESMNAGLVPSTGIPPEVYDYRPVIPVSSQPEMWQYPNGRADAGLMAAAHRRGYIAVGNVD